MIPKYPRTNAERIAEGFAPVGTLQAPEPPPTGDGQAVWPLIIMRVGDEYPLLKQHMLDRHAFGVAKYGTPLRTNNGRRPLVDALQESLDKIAYLGQYLTEKGFDTPSAVRNMLYRELEDAEQLVVWIEAGQ